jgi:hypothetical protein
MSNDKSNKVMEILDLMLSDIISDEKLKKFGINREEYHSIIKTYVPNTEPYQRIYTKDDQKALTPEAYGYLYHLLLMRSINRDLFEKMIFFSFHLHEIFNQKVNKKMADDMLNFIIFSGHEEVTLDDLMDFCMNAEHFIQ